MKSMTALLVALAMMSTSACSRDSFPAAFEERPTRRFAPADNEYYSPPEPG